MTHVPSTTRLAPSPTGALHLGNARTFLVNYLLARRGGWRIRMRIEDLDTPRTKPDADRGALADLAWLGLTWQPDILYQSARAPAYHAALQQLIDAGAAYPCVCSRKDIQAAGGAPHAEDHVVVYPGTCRDRYNSAEQAQAASDRPIAWRVRVDDEPIRFDDRFAGPQRFRLARTCGDFVIFRGSGLAAYQLAVVIDDHDTGVDAIVRGDDLIESAARQIHLRRLLGLSERPVTYWHLPLVLGPDGRRLAKRHGDTRIDTYRRTGCPPERMLGLLGWWTGLLPDRRPADLDELVRRFDPSAIPPGPVTFTPEDDAFLRHT